MKTLVLKMIALQCKYHHIYIFLVITQQPLIISSQPATLKVNNNVVFFATCSKGRGTFFREGAALQILETQMKRVWFVEEKL